MRKALLAAIAWLMATGAAAAADDVMVVFDGSNSMWGQIAGTAKIEIARDAMDSLMGEWTEGTNVGLMAYGHRREADCEDIETLIEPGPFDREAFFSKVGDITPRGKTPLTTSIEQAAETLAYRDNPATLVVITDGIETCRRDPCALADELERMGVGFTAHVVGFDLKDEEHEAVACIAERTGGRFLPAGDAAELGTALSEVGATVAKAPEPEPEPEPAPEVELTAPETAISGETVPVSWQAETQHPKDYITIVPMGAEEGAYTSYFRVKEDSEGSLRAPSGTGMFEVRYVRDEDDSTLASAEIEITEPEVTVSAPETATTGATFPVSWTGNVHPKDYITIVPMGADEGAYTDYIRVKEDSEGQLQAPAETGFYEVRYVLDEGDRTLASAEIEITEPEVTVSAPETATTGATFPVSWTGNVHPKDYITIVPMGADEGAYTDYIRVGEDSEGQLQAPAETGLYEVRYVLDEGDRTLASAEIEITEPEVTVSAPETATTGATFPVSWTGNVHPKDYITIVPMGTDEGAYTDYIRVGEDSEGQLQAPADTGLYEVRYVLDKGDRTLASAEIEITEPEVEVSAPDSAATGSTFQVSWTGTIHSRDFVTIVPLGADGDEIGNHDRVGDSSETELRAPSEPGLYEVRYVLDEGRKPLASAEIEITEPEVTVSAPDSVTTGSTFPVSWTGTIHSRDFITIVPLGADGDEIGNHDRIGDSSETELRAPSEPGLYEVRYVLDEGRKPLASAEIEITEPEVTISAPDSATTGSTFPVSWTGTIHSRDFVTIVPLGSDDDEIGNHDRVGGSSETELRAPSEPGLYEVRYVLDEGRKTLASTEIEITEAGIELSGPDKVRAGSEIGISWSGTPPHRRDFITIVPMGAAEGEIGNHDRVGSNSETDLEAPEQTGLYEVRYVLDEGRRTLARHNVEIVDETAALDRGGSLEVPETAAAGETIEISWSVDTESGDQRIALAQADQADFTWIEVQSASEGPPLSFTLPEDAGQYEFRLLDIPGRKVLSRSIIDVQ